MEAEKSYSEGGFDAREVYQTLQALRDFAYGAGGDAAEKIWITRTEARVITNLVWLMVEKFVKGRPEDDDE